MKNRSWRSFGHHGVLLLALLVGLLIALPASAQSPVNTKLLTLIGTGADSGISFELLGQDLAAPNLHPTFSFISCTVPAGESCSQAAYDAGGGILRLSTNAGGGSKNRTWSFPRYIQSGVYVTAGGFGLEPGTLIVSGVDATAGTPQSNPAGAALAFSLEVTYTAPGPVYQSGVPVSFTGPGSGRGITPASSTVMTDSSGRARFRPTANGIAGVYQVTASATVSGNMTETDFLLANRNTANAVGACQVTNGNDDLSPGSLRSQVATCGTGGTITFAPSVTTVTLGQFQDIQLRQNLTIDGGGTVTISGNEKSRIFLMTGGNVLLKDLTLTNGATSAGAGGLGGSGGGGGAAGMGGAIFVNAGSLTINNVEFVTNTAMGGSGGGSDSSAAAGGGAGTGGPGGTVLSSGPTNGNGGGGADFGSRGGAGTGGANNGSGAGAGGGNGGSGAFGGGGSSGLALGSAGGFGGGGGGGAAGGAGGTFEVAAEHCPAAEAPASAVPSSCEAAR
jgi:hypothetical protein